MRGYAEQEVFTSRELDLLHLASAAVAKLPERIDGEWVRCHEVARAIGRLLKLEVADGWYGMVEHSWLWTSTVERVDGIWLGPLPNILDVYVPGHLPQVQLIHTARPLPLDYRRGDMRHDIKEALVERLLREIAHET